MEIQLRLSGDELDIGAGCMKESRQVQRGGSASKHNDIFALELAWILMPRAMRNKLLGQTRQRLRDILEMSDANCQNHTLGLAGFTVLEQQFETVTIAAYPLHHLVFKFGHHTLAERNAVGSESLEFDRETHFLIRNTPLGTERLQRESAMWIVEVGRKSIG